MKLICMAKFVPDVDKFKYDFENNTVVRENVRMILNPDDSSAIGFALKFKESHPNTFVEIVTMAPMSVIPLIEDLIRLGADKVTLITDKCFSGSDSYATSIILSSYLKYESYDCILTGTHAIDGDTSHIPAQLGELLNLCQISNVIDIDENKINELSAVFTVDNESSTLIYEMKLPGILSLQKTNKFKLPYIKFDNLNMDVSDRINIISNDDLKLNPTYVGLKGSLTKVNRTFVKEYEKREKVIVGTDEDGIDKVYLFLKSKGFL